MSQIGKKIVIVGGVAGGVSAAARARRLDENASIVMFQRSGYLFYLNCSLPYHIGNTITKSETLLVTTSKELWNRFRIDARVSHEVTAINRDRKTITVKTLLMKVSLKSPMMLCFSHLASTYIIGHSWRNICQLYISCAPLRTWMP